MPKGQGAWSFDCVGFQWISFLLTQKLSASHLNVFGVLIVNDSFRSFKANCLTERLFAFVIRTDMFILSWQQAQLFWSSCNPCKLIKKLKRDSIHVTLIRDQEKRDTRKFSTVVEFLSMYPVPFLQLYMTSMIQLLSSRTKLSGCTRIIMRK